MADYSHERLRDLLDSIKSQRVVLPAMQRNFVWPEDKIYHLFDSMMHDYPIGTFLFWKIDANTFNMYTFNTFIQSYDEEKGKMQRGNKATGVFSDYLAVLDGQQRITAIYLGVTGKYRTHIKGKKWDDASSYYNRVLCIDVLHVPSEEDEDYRFCFINEADVEKVVQESDPNKKDVIKNAFWVPVKKVYDGLDCSEYTDDLESKYPDVVSSEVRKRARKMLERLEDAFKGDVNYYEAKDKTLPEVVEIFVRVNSGGQKLNSSDLMLSVAAGEQSGDSDIHVVMQDAIEEINESVDNVDEGFRVDKELILTAGLMFTGAESLSLQKPENYVPSQMNSIFKDNWDKIKDALKTTVKYIEYLGFNGNKLTSKNLVLPIAYYFYINGIVDQHQKNNNRARCDRIFIRQWLLRAMINSVFKDGTGSTLIQMRALIEKTDKKYFPLDELMIKEIKKTLKIGDEQITDILQLKYGDSRIVPIYDELNKATNNSKNQVDHIWAKAILLSKKAIKNAYPMATEEDIKQFKDKCHYIANLELLDGLVNQRKDNREFKEWLIAEYPDPEDQKKFMKEHFIPEGVSYDFKEFLPFIDAREKLLAEKIKEAFPSDFSEIVNRYNLSGCLN